MLNPSSNAKPTLLRVTTNFDTDQDRIKLTGSTTGAEVHELWLTHRLLNRLLPGLWSWLQAQPTVGVAVDAVAASATADPQRQQALQEFAQQQASASLPKQPPVVSTPQTLPWLVRSMQLQSSAQLMQLNFFSANEVEKAQEPGEHSAALSMNATQLRQWLGILLGEYRRAEWPIEHWPQWMQSPSTPTAVAHLH